MRRTIVSLAVFMLAAVMSLWGQSQPNTIARIYEVKVKPGEGQQWEAGLKRLNAWSHEHNMPGNSYTWVVITGPKEGEYLLGQFGHAWKDFDTMHQEGVKAGWAKEIQATVAPHTESVETSFYAFQPDLSIHPSDPNKTPSTLSSVSVFTLKPGGTGPVVSAIKQADEAIKKTHWGGDHGGGWYILVNGGVGPEIVLTNDLHNMAGMAPPSRSLNAVLTSVYGKAKAEALMHSFDSHVRSVRTEIIAYRPDLSYIAQAH